MIPRYTRPEMASIWEPQTRFKIWFEIEAHAADAQAETRRDPERSRQDDLGQGKDADLHIERIDETSARPSTTSSPSPPIWPKSSAPSRASSTRA